MRKITDSVQETSNVILSCAHVEKERFSYFVTTSRSSLATPGRMKYERELSRCMNIIEICRDFDLKTMFI